MESALWKPLNFLVANIMGFYGLWNLRMNFVTFVVFISYVWTFNKDIDVREFQSVQMYMKDIMILIIIKHIGSNV